MCYKLLILLVIFYLFDFIEFIIMWLNGERHGVAYCHVELALP